MSNAASRTLVLAAAIAAAGLPATAATSPDSVVLWSQTQGDIGNALASQNFEASFDAYDCQAADDFVVPEGEAWVIKTVEVVGTYFSHTGPARSENVVFYRNANGKPGSVIGSYPEVVGDDPYFGSFVITLPEPLKLKPGRHWLSVQANIDYWQGGLWGWEATSLRRERSATWMNPLDGFDTGCTTYQGVRACTQLEGKDFVFTLYGQRKPLP